MTTGCTAPGRMLISVDARRKWFGSVEEAAGSRRKRGTDVDEKIHYIAERELETAMKETRSRRRHDCGAKSSHRGNFALANRPTFNPNLSRQITRQIERSRGHDVYEPGSTSKS
jgi:cell division protein FtsI/penicillin-binding protein 2